MTTIKIEKKIKIEKNIPIKKKNGFGTQYPWDKMEIGDSFYLEIPKGVKYITHQSSVLTTSRSWAMYNNESAKFSSRKERKGFRVWRIA